MRYFLLAGASLCLASNALADNLQSITALPTAMKTAITVIDDAQSCAQSLVNWAQNYFAANNKMPTGGTADLTAFKAARDAIPQCASMTVTLPDENDGPNSCEVGTFMVQIPSGHDAKLAAGMTILAVMPTHLFDGSGVQWSFDTNVNTDDSTQVATGKPKFYMSATTPAGVDLTAVPVAGSTTAEVNLLSYTNASANKHVSDIDAADIIGTRYYYGTPKALKCHD